MRTCPRCALVNSDESQRCDCGYFFLGETPDSFGSEVRTARQSAYAGIVQGLVIGGVALGFSVWSFVMASPGGRFWIAHGGIIVGLAMAWRNWDRLTRLADAKVEGPMQPPK